MHFIFNISLFLSLKHHHYSRYSKIFKLNICLEQNTCIGIGNWNEIANCILHCAAAPHVHYVHCVFTPAAAADRRDDISYIEKETRSGLEAEFIA